MAWPIDARLTTYSPGSPIKSSDLNAMQDETIVQRGELDPILTWLNSTDRVYTVGWQHAIEPTHVGAWVVSSNLYLSNSGGSNPDLFIPGPILGGPGNSGTLIKIDVKLYLNVSSAFMFAYVLDTKMESDTTTPTSTEIVDFGGLSGTTEYSVESSGAISVTIGASTHKQVMIKLTRVTGTELGFVGASFTWRPDDIT